MRALLLWVTTIALVFLGQIMEGGHVGSVMQLTAAVIVLLPVIAYLFYAHGFVGFFKFSKRLISSSLTDEDLPIIDTSATLGFLFGGIGCVMGIIHVMENLSDTSKLGAGIAVAFVSVIYGALPAILLLPVKNNSNAEAFIVSDMTKKAAGFTAASITMLLMSWFVVLFATSHRG